MYKALTALILSVSFPVLAETAISHIVVNQRWPWSEKVDVDFILSGETNDVEVTATWDAHPAPYRLGTLFAVAPGQRRLTWDPASSPFRGQTLTGFTVSVSNAAASAHNYIVVDLVNGGYEFMARLDRRAQVVEDGLQAHPRRNVHAGRGEGGVYRCFRPFGFLCKHIRLSLEPSHSYIYK